MTAFSTAIRCDAVSSVPSTSLGCHVYSDSWRYAAAEFVYVYRLWRRCSAGFVTRGIYIPPSDKPSATTGQKYRVFTDKYCNARQLSLWRRHCAGSKYGGSVQLPRK